MDPEWEIYLFICIFQFSFVLTILSSLFWKPFRFIASPGIPFAFSVCLSTTNLLILTSLYVQIFRHHLLFFFLQIVEIMEWTVRVIVSAQIA